MQYLLDTNTCIAVMKNEPIAVANMSAVASLDCAVSTISAYELFTGVAKCSRPAIEAAKVGKLLQSVHKLPFDLAAAGRRRKYGPNWNRKA